jgi:cold shock CspA family protein
MIGRITYWNNESGYGFLKPDNPSEPDQFVHHIAFAKAYLDPPSKRDSEARYEFDVEQIPNGRTRATNLRRLNPPVVDSE